jgi:hypothetical protein
MTKSRWTIPLRISTYRMRVESIPDDYTFEEDVLGALIGRSALQEHWDELAEEQREEVHRIDDMLVGLHARVAEALDTVVRQREPDHTHWWWYLDQGPKVREEAERATT